MNGDDLEGRQVQVGEAGILQVVEVPLRQGVPAPSAPARHLERAGPPPHTPQCPLQPHCQSAHQVLGRAGAERRVPRLAAALALLTGGPCPAPSYSAQTGLLH